MPNVGTFSTRDVGRASASRRSAASPFDGRLRWIQLYEVTSLLEIAPWGSTVLRRERA